MSKGTNYFGHDKALACESWGFVYKKRGCIVLTHPHTHTDEAVEFTTRLVFLFVRNQGAEYFCKKR